MYTHVNQMHTDNGSDRSWKACLNHIVHTLFVLFPSRDMLKRETQVTVPVMSDVNRKTIAAVGGRAFADVISEMLAKDITVNDMQPPSMIRRSTGRHRQSTAHLVHAKWEIARRLNGCKKEVMAWREDMTFNCSIFPPIPLENLSWAEMVGVGKI